MPRSGMTRSVLTSPPTAVADAQRGAIDAAAHRDHGTDPGQGLRQTPAGLLFVILADRQRRPTAPRKEHLYGRPPRRGWRAWQRRVVIIRCERRLFVNTLAKNWAMTIRQIGWLKVHPSLGRKTETMIPYVAPSVRLLRPWAAIPFWQRRTPSWVCRGSDPMYRPLGLARCPSLAVPPATGTCLRGKAGWRRRTENSINKALGGRRGRGSRVCAPVARGVRYNWKGPPIGLPPCAAVDRGPAPIQFRVH